jgi:Fe-S-cluster-containing dehydrogenase component
MKRTPYEFSETSTTPSITAPMVWRSVEEKARLDELAALETAQVAPPLSAVTDATSEFPSGVVDGVAAHEGADAGADFVRVDQLVSRRNFMKLTTASAALLGMEGCMLRRPEEKILPYTLAPEYALPGATLHYATVMEHQGDSVGLLVESHEGRPTKIEGNPQHPASLGGTDMRVQAAIMDLYDPDRSGYVVSKHAKKGTQLGIADFEKQLHARMALHRGTDGEGLHVLAPPTNSPTLIRLRTQLLEQYPNAKWYCHTAFSQRNKLEGAKIALGQPVHTRVQLEQAKVILSLDSDFLLNEPGAIRHSRDFAAGRRLRGVRDDMNRLYVVEPSMSVTGANADHRLALAASEVGNYLVALGHDLATRHKLEVGALQAIQTPSVPEKWLRAVADDLIANRGKSAILVGSGQPAHVHALAHVLNAALGNVGPVLSYLPVVDSHGFEQSHGIDALVAAAKGGKVKTLLILGGNPVYETSRSVGFRDVLASVEFSAHLATRVNETSKLCTWHIPEAHFLEAWGDQRSLDGVLAVQQPLIAPLRGGVSAIEVLGMALGMQDWRGHGLVRTTWKSISEGVQREGRQDALLPPDLSFDHVWARALKTGLLVGSEFAPLLDVKVRTQEVAASVSQSRPAGVASAQNLELVVRPDNKLLDGRHGNNPWLLEMPDPITRISWDNALYVSKNTAEAMGVQSGDLVEVQAQGGSARIVAWVAPGQADHVLTTTAGWGQAECGRYGKGHGFDVSAVLPAQGLVQSGVQVRKLGQRYPVSQTQEHNTMEGRPLALYATLQEYREQPEFARYKSVTPAVPPLWKEVEYKGHKWGMSIDLTACTGCNACSVACQSENNTPTVGKEEVAKTREMHWLRVDRYFVGHDQHQPEVAFQPVMCVHCEEAPCENVCPVNATVHSPEGTNDMAYNRCIGTRYCANNCPYKVRRFNFKDWHGTVPETKKMQFNPNVTVRMRGVMEKCTYCIQRVEEGKINAKRENRPLRDGDIVTACQQACPTEAIVFGDLNDPNSRVAKLSQFDRGYKLLGEIGTQPRTTYLAKVRNPNPQMHEGSHA